MPLKKSTKLFWDIWALIEAILLIASGVMDIFWSSNSLIQTLSIIFAASFIIADGLSRFIFMLIQYDKEKKDQESAILVAGIEITAGIVIIVLRENIMQAVIWALASILLSLGSLLLIYALVLLIRKLHTKMWLALTEVLGGALGVALGVLVIFAKIKLGDVFTTIIVGIVLALLGLVIMIISFLDICKDNKAKKEAKMKAKAGNAPQKKEDDSKQTKKSKDESNIIEVETTEVGENEKLTYSKKK